MTFTSSTQEWGRQCRLLTLSLVILLLGGNSPVWDGINIEIENRNLGTAS